MDRVLAVGNKQIKTGLQGSDLDNFRMHSVIYQFTYLLTTINSVADLHIISRVRWRIPLISKKELLYKDNPWDDIAINTRPHFLHNAAW